VPPAERRGILTDVDRDIVDRAPKTAHELPLGFGENLVMEPAQNAALRPRLVFLHERARYSRLGEIPGPEDLGKMPPLVPGLLVFDLDKAFERKPREPELHMPG